MVAEAMKRQRMSLEKKQKDSSKIQWIDLRQKE